MKLLPQKEAQTQVKRDNERVIDETLRLQAYQKKLKQRLTTLKQDYSSDKAAALREFEAWRKDLEAQKQKLLAELAQWQQLLKDTKEQYYALIEKQDRLTELEYKIGEEMEKLKLREAFVSELEKKMLTKT